MGLNVERPHIAALQPVSGRSLCSCSSSGQRTISAGDITELRHAITTYNTIREVNSLARFLKMFFSFIPTVKHAHKHNPTIKRACVCGWMGVCCQIFGVCVCHMGDKLGFTAMCENLITVSCISTLVGIFKHSVWKQFHCLLLEHRIKRFIRLKCEFYKHQRTTIQCYYQRG